MLPCAVYRIVNKIDAEEALRMAEAFRKENQLLIRENQERTVRAPNERASGGTTHDLRLLTAARGGARAL